MADVFLSYARPNSAVAGRIERALRARGLSVWYDRELPAHRAYSDVIEAELEKARAVLVLWSRASVESQWVRSEANRARELGRLVQARVDDVRLPLPFDQIQCADLSKWRAGRENAGWSQIVRSIDSLVGGEAQVLPHREIAVDRRKLMLGGGAAAAAIAGGSFWWLRSPHDDGSSPESRILFQKGTDALQSDDPDQREQAIPLLTEATRLSPRYATAWGALALAYSSAYFGVGRAERPGYAARTRAAAGKAFALEPNEGRALGALQALEITYGNWFNAERDFRAGLAHHPDLPLLLDNVALVLMDVGRWAAAIPYLSRMDRVHYLLPGADRHLVLGLWSSGDLPGAEQALQQAVERWPQHGQVWRTRLLFLTHSGRANEALALLDGPNRPPRIPDEFVAAAKSTAEALLGTQTRGEAVKKNLLFLRTTPAAALLVAQRCAALGDADATFAILDGYYFAEGPWASVAPVGGDQDRITSPLFEPPVQPIWGDRRFAALLVRTGLENYWRQSGTHPDFRKLA